MKRIVTLSLVASLMCWSMSSVSEAAPRVEVATTGEISGIAVDAAGAPIPHSQVRLRDVDTGRLIGQASTNATGQFSFPNLSPGTYLLELLDAAGSLVGARRVVVSVDDSAAGSVRLERTAAGTGGSITGFLTSRAGVIVLSAAGAGLGTGLYVSVRSPSK